MSSVRQQSLDKHTQEIENLHAALSRQYQEDLLNMKMELSDKYTYELENLKIMHSSEMEQLKARLSEEHIKGEMTLRIFLLRKNDSDLYDFRFCKCCLAAMFKLLFQCFCH